MRIGATTPNMPTGFEVCPPPPPDAQQVGDPVDMGDGWSATVFVDNSTGVKYVEYYNDVDNEWLWYCGVPGQNLSAKELIELTEGAWGDSKKKTALWAGVGAVAGILGGMVVASKTRGNSLLYGALGAGAGAAAGALILMVAFRPTSYAQTAGLGKTTTPRRQTRKAQTILNYVTPLLNVEELTQYPPGCEQYESCNSYLRRAYGAAVSYIDGKPTVSWIDVWGAWSRVHNNCPGPFPVL